MQNGTKVVVLPANEREANRQYPTRIEKEVQVPTLYKSDKCSCLNAATNDILTMKSLILAQDER